jgi:predicted DNA-binding protein YlxM (UPF0122 family)
VWFERGINVAKNLDVVLLADFYGEMLTDNQRKFIEYYYSDDLSLSEIAQNEGITRQGVRDAVKRAETQLYDMEKKLGFAERTRKITEALDVVMENIEEINKYNMNISLSREVNDAVVNIKSAIIALDE